MKPDLKTTRLAISQASSQIERLSALVAVHEQTHAAFAVPDPAAAQKALEEAGAAHALGEIDATEFAAAKSAFADAQRSAAAARSEQSASTAVLTGIERRLDAARNEFQKARADEKEALWAWARAEIESADTEYLAHATAAASAVLRHEALREWMTRQGAAVVGRSPFRIELKLPVLGEVSAAAVMARPGPQPFYPGGQYQADLAPRPDVAGALVALQSEVDEMLAAAEPAPGKLTGLLARVKKQIASI